MTERRRAPRFDTDLTALFIDHDIVRAVEVTDLSACGAALKFHNNEPVHMGDAIRLHLYDRHTCELVANLQGHVTRLIDVAPLSIGVSLEQCPESLGHTLDYLYRSQLRKEA